MSKRLNVYKDQKPIYDIVMEPSFEKLTEEVNKFHLSERKICIVTDTNVAPLSCYAPGISAGVSKAGPVYGKDCGTNSPGGNWGGQN